MRFKTNVSQDARKANPILVILTYLIPTLGIFLYFANSKKNKEIAVQYKNAALYGMFAWVIVYWLLGSSLLLYVPEVLLIVMAFLILTAGLYVITCIHKMTIKVESKDDCNIYGINIVSKSDETFNEVCVDITSISAVLVCIVLCVMNTFYHETMNNYIFLACFIPIIINRLFYPIYLYPSKVARRYQHNQTTVIVWLNYFLGGTIILWIILLIWANTASENKKGLLEKS